MVPLLIGHRAIFARRVTYNYAFSPINKIIIFYFRNMSGMGVIIAYCNTILKDSGNQYLQIYNKITNCFFDNVCFMSTICIWETMILKSFVFIIISFCKIYNIRLLSDRNKILNDEQIDNGITLKSKPIMQKTLYFLKKWNV